MSHYQALQIHNKQKSVTKKVIRENVIRKMKTCKMSGSLLLAFLAISNALQSNLSVLESKIKLNNGEDTYPSFVTLNENQYEYVVSFGKLQNRDYFHLCFAVMILSNYGYTCNTCAGTSSLHGTRHIKHRREPGTNTDSILTVDQYLELDIYNSRVAQCETNTDLVFFKLHGHFDYLESSRIRPRYESDGATEMIGYKADCDEPAYLVSNIVKVPVKMYEKKRTEQPRNTDAIFIKLLERNVKLASVDRGSVVLGKTGGLKGMLIKPETGLFIMLRRYSGSFGDVLSYMERQRRSDLGGE